MTNNQRLYYLDWIRVGAFGLLFLFHTLRFFDVYPWHIKNSESSVFLNYFVEFVHNWRMQLIFFISGVGTYFALQKRNGKFLQDRTYRLLIPYVFGIVLLVPPQKYFEAIHQGVYQGDFWPFLMTYPGQLFSRNIGLSLNWMGHLGYHLWYLPYLFVQTILLYPVLQVLRKQQSMLIQFRNSSWLLVIFISLILMEFFLRPIYPEYLGWADFIGYTTFFFLGFMFQLSENFRSKVKKNVLLLFFTGVLCFIISMSFETHLREWSQPSHQFKYLLIMILKNVNTYAWVFTIIGVAIKFLNIRHKLLKDLNQGILPFYILHQTVIILIGFYVVQWSSGIPEKFIVILLSSFTLTILLYQIIWRNNIMRFIFGMKKKVINNKNVDKKLLVK